MKKVFVILAVFAILFGAFPVTAFAADKEITWKTYTDKKFGFSVEYPGIYDEIDDPYVDGDGLSNFGATLGSSGGKHAFTVIGGKNADKATAKSKLKDWTSMEEDDSGYVSGVEPIPDTAKSGDGFFTLDYLNDSAGVDKNGEPACVTHIYGIVTKNLVVTYTVTYPKEDADRFADITSRMDKSLKVKK
jgi:hypothetical protein